MVKYFLDFLDRAISMTFAQQESYEKSTPRLGLFFPQKIFFTYFFAAFKIPLNETSFNGRIERKKRQKP